jgi:predicted TPR repeat methyltransferase
VSRQVELLYRGAYRLGLKPWDTGVVPPELVALVEGPDALRPGRALDLGCGTGTHVVYLEHRGWLTTGVDLAGQLTSL